jgi:cytoskeletal protein RodZ
MKDDKSFKILSISLSLLVVLSACTLTNISGLQTSSPISPIPSMTLQSSSTQIETNTNIHTSTAPVATASPTSTTTTTVTTTATSTTTSTATSISPVTLNWQAYTYTCEFASGGTTMTMSLTWSDSSNSEDGYRVYRDNVVIATLPPNTTSYVDVAFIATGNTVSYSVEAFNQGWQVSTSTIVYACQ